MARIPYVVVEQASENARRVLQRLPAPLHVFRLAAHADGALRPLISLGAAILQRGTLDAAIRELCILRVAALSEAEYEWVQHEALARVVGAADEQIEAVRAGDLDDPSLGPKARIALRFTTETVRDVRVSDETFEAARAAFADRDLVELVLCVGYYMMLARLMRTFDIDPDPAVGGALLGAD